MSLPETLCKSVIHLRDFYCQGPWAVIDGFTNGIWVNVEHRRLAEVIARTFTAKLNCAVVDISQARNYQTNLIDSESALDWSLEKQHEAYTPGLPKLTGLELSAYSAEGCLLFNHDGAPALDRSQRQQLQTQVFSLICLLRVIWPELGWYGIDLPETDADLLREFTDCYAIELNLPDIEKRLFSVCLNNMDRWPEKCLNMLTFLGRLYD